MIGRQMSHERMLLFSLGFIDTPYSTTDVSIEYSMPFDLYQ